MDVLNEYTHFQKTQVAAGTVVTIGNFDGVHRGHQAILRNSSSIAHEMQLRFVVCTFEPHPAALFARGDVPARLTSPTRKAALLAEVSPDLLLIQNFTREFAGMDPALFVQSALVSAMNARVVVVGKNFRFGKNRAGDLTLLQEMGRENGFDVLAEDLLSTTDEVISSTRIRELLAAGDVARAADLLGRYHELPGLVVHGKKMGAVLGFPTLNIAPEDVLIPADGIYAATVDVGADRDLPAAVYVGDRPTLHHGYSIEAHLLDFSRDVYNEHATLHFLKRIRENRQFDDIKSLQSQIVNDIDVIKRHIGDMNP
jgi:riboflavin kinase / FMN adenylyltransferase